MPLVSPGSLVSATTRKSELTCRTDKVIVYTLRPPVSSFDWAHSRPTGSLPDLAEDLFNVAVHAVVADAGP